MFAQLKWSVKVQLDELNCCILLTFGINKNEVKKGFQFVTFGVRDLSDVIPKLALINEVTLTGGVCVCV